MGSIIYFSVPWNIESVVFWKWPNLLFFGNYHCFQFIFLSWNNVWWLFNCSLGTAEMGIFSDCYEECIALFSCSSCYVAWEADVLWERWHPGSGGRWTRRLTSEDNNNVVEFVMTVGFRDRCRLDSIVFTKHLSTRTIVMLWNPHFRP